MCLFDILLVLQTFQTSYAENYHDSPIKQTQVQQSSFLPISANWATVHSFCQTKELRIIPELLSPSPHTTRLVSSFTKPLPIHSLLSGHCSPSPTRPPPSVSWGILPSRLSISNTYLFRKDFFFSQSGIMLLLFRRLTFALCF